MKVKIYKINKNLIVQKSGDKMVIFTGEESELHTLNETASYIFHAIKKGWGSEQIIEGLVKKFSAEQKEAESDLEDLYQLLLQKKIISVKD